MRFPRPWRLRARSAADPAPRSDQRQLDRMAQAIAYFLDEDDEVAMCMAEAALQGRRQPSAPPAQLLHALRGEIAAALLRGPCLLALPCHTEALGVLRALAQDANIKLVLVDSPAAAAMADEFMAGGALARCATQDLVRRVKQARADDARTVYVSFPELHALANGTTASVLFLGKVCRISVFDALLCVAGLASMITLCYSAGQSRLAPVSWQADSQGQSRSLSAALGWLWSHLQGVASAAPRQLLSWPALYRASDHCRQIEGEQHLRQLAAYFDLWRSARAGLDDDAYQFAMARLAAMRAPAGAPA